MRTRTAVHYNPSILCNNADDDVDDDEHNHDIRPPTVNHILWQEKANEFIKQCYKNDTKQQRGTTFKVLSRHSTGGNNDVGVLYTHPSAIAMMTLNKRASQGDMPRGRAEEQLILTENNGLAGNELLTARKRHLRDLFSGDLGLPPVPPPPPLPPMPLTAGSHAPSQRTHVGNVVHTFETLAMQRRLAAFKQHEQHQLRIKNALQTKHKQKQNESSTFSKYLKSNNRNTKQKQQQQQQKEQSMPHCSATITNNNFSTHMKNNNTTFNERNKQISQQFLQQMEIDYRKNLFSKQSHVNNNTNHKFNNNNNNNSYNINDATISEGEAGVVAKFDEMLAGYSTTAADDDDDNDDNDNDDVDMDNNARVSIININRNEAQNNVFHINLSSTTNGRATKSENLTDTCTNIKQLKCSNTNQLLLPIMRKKPVAPLPPPKPQTKTATTTTSMQTTSKQQFIESCNHVLSQHHHNQAESNAQLVESNEFLRGTTLSESFVCQPNWQHRKKPKAPKPPILPITTPVVKNITKNKQIKANTQLRIAITNPFRHVLRLNSKNSDSFNLLQNVN